MTPIVGIYSSILLKIIMKTNFKTKKTPKRDIKSKEKNSSSKNFSQDEFEEFVKKSGAAGSFMIFRSKKKKNELGIDNL